MRFPLLYAGWIALCAVLFVGLSGADDPSRRHDRILSNDAGAMAEQVLQKSNPAYRGYGVVHVAYASRDRSGEARWIVLLDSEPHSALKNAIVVELRASDGSLLRVRKPTR